MRYQYLPAVDPQIAGYVEGEERRQAFGLELIASENYVSAAVMEAMGSVFNNKYSEGYPGRRYYGGQEYTDLVETDAIERAKKLFGAAHANVQPHAGAIANLAAYLALASLGDTIMGMELSHGGHLTHGHPVTHAAKMFRFVRYKMKDIATGEIDYDDMLEVARREKPKIIIAGFSAYSRELDYARIRAIADDVGAFALADVAHIAGMIAGGALANPFDAGFDVVTTTTHKSLRGPRGGLVLSRDPKIGKKIDSSVFPGLQGGPIMQMIAAKAVCFHEALQPQFKDYAHQTIRNAKAMAERFTEHGVTIVSGGTDNHLMLIDCRKNFDKSGNDVQVLLDDVGITLNKNMVPDDTAKALDPSGIRLGTPALTTRGMREPEMRTAVDLMVRAIKAHGKDELDAVRHDVVALASGFPVPGITVEPSANGGARDGGTRAAQPVT
jgi:glycine hydroxymethyltransferase